MQTNEGRNLCYVFFISDSHNLFLHRRYALLKLLFLHHQSSIMQQNSCRKENDDILHSAIQNYYSEDTCTDFQQYFLFHAENLQEDYLQLFDFLAYLKCNLQFPTNLLMLSP